MTNIMALKVSEKPAKSNQPSREYILCCADGQSTSLAGGGSKSGTAQKLVRVGNNFVMGTGVADWIHQCVSALYGQFRAEDGPVDLGKKILEYSQTIQVPQRSDSGLQFIVAGYAPDQPSIMDVYAIVPDGMQRGMYPNGFLSILGSGSRFASPAVSRDFETGVRIPPADLAEGLLALFDLAETASKDLGVNDRYQFGLVCPDGSLFELFHPEVQLGARPGYKHDYFTQLLGVTPPWPRDANPKRQDLDALIPLCDMAWGFYNAFVGNLGRLQSFDCWTNVSASKLKTGTETLKGLKEMLSRRSAQKENVLRVIDAWTSRSLEKARGVVLDFQARMTDSYDTLKKMYDAQHPLPGPVPTVNDGGR